MMISRFGALANMISAAEKKLGPKCVINNNFAKDYRDSTNYLNKYPQYYSISKGLSGDYIKALLHLVRVTLPMRWIVFVHQVS